MQRITLRRCGRSKKKVTNRSHKQRVNTVEDSDSSDTEYFVGTINQKDISAVNTGLYKTIETEGVKVNFQLDTGAKCNIILHRVFKTLCQVSDKKMPKSRARLTSYSGHHIKTLGLTNLTCVCKNVEHNVQFFVIEIDSTAILGIEGCQRLGLIERLCSVGVDITEEYALIQGIRLSSWRIQNQAQPKCSTCGTCSEKGTSSTP